MVVAHPHDKVSASTRADGTGLRTREIDNALLQRAGGGDRDAFAALYERHAGNVYGLACRVLRSPALAEEVTQDVFLTVWTKSPTFDRSRGSARTWILTIAHRRAVDVVRREESQRSRLSRTAAMSVQQPVDVVSEGVVERAGAQWEDEQLGRALRSLTELQRAAIQLAYFGGFTYAQVAEELGVPLPTAKTRIRDGLRRLASELATAMSIDDDHRAPYAKERTAVLPRRAKAS